ncbi:radical SAM protein [Luteolibacter soli]|uniref:Radical SAM protein n=1 Tax=Luteolibacter soli TaxID=3135280 RepID=A0ABU9B2I2_9BACT
MNSVLVAALPWNLADMMSVQVAALKSFLTSKGIDALGRHYYLGTDRFFSDEEIDLIHSRFLGDHLYGMLLFPECSEAIGARIYEKSGGKMDPRSCLERIRAFTESVADDIVALGPALVGFTTTHMQYLGSIATAKAVRERMPDTKFVLGGLALHGEPARNTLALFPWIDFIVVGEGESALWRLSQHIRGDRPIEEVPQVIYQVNGIIQENPSIESIGDIDDLPFPDYSDYFVQLKARSRSITPRATVEMVRGCRWGRCSFCIEGLPTRGGFRTKTPTRVVKEIQRYVEDYQILDFVTSDPDVAFNAPIFEEISNLGYDLSFMVELSGLVRVPQFDVMIAAGVQTVQIGIESFSPGLLKSFNKGVSLAKYVELLRYCAERGIKLVYNNIYRSPFEVQQNLEESVENMRRLMYFQPPRLSEFRVSVGSAIMNDYQKYGIKRLLPSDEVIGYPDEIAARVGMLISFNAGFGFERADGVQDPDHGPYLELLEEWRSMWLLKPRRRARRGLNFVRIDHQIGNECYQVEISNALEISLFEFCQKLRSRRELRSKFSDVAPEELDAAIERLWDRHLLFRTAEECIALVSLSSSRESFSQIAESTLSEAN